MRDEEQQTEEDGSYDDTATPERSLADRIADAIAPYPNFSAYLLNKHHWDSPQKSQEDRRALIHNVLLHELFDRNELRGINFEALDEELSRMAVDDSTSCLGRGWKKSSVTIPVPHGKKKDRPSKEECLFEIPNLLHRSVADLVCDEFAKPKAKSFHFTPFEEHWHRPDGGKEKVVGEMYSSPAFREAHNEIQNLPAEPGCDLPRACAGIILMSDSAHLTDFGDAQIHPFNVGFVNESKYPRGRPSSHSIHPVMYLQKVPDTIHEFASRISGKPKSRKNKVFTHCRREYFHGALKVLCDASFWDMYAHGRVVKCGDGITRRLYLRLFTYSADYPEKVLVATIRDGGLCPCPRCHVKHDDLDQMGTPADTNTRLNRAREDTEQRRKAIRKARRYIYQQGYAVSSKQVETLLKDDSYVPVENAFSFTSSGIKINVFDLLVVDLLHELELGVWVALLAHLIRILHTLGDEKITELNRRYAAVAPFGRDTIRRFSDHVADMSKMTAHEYGQMLACAAPCFEGLFPDPWDDEIQLLLFTLARWHKLAKLRLHTESTLLQLERVTIQFGTALRKFRDGCCEAFDTRETPAECEKRVRTAQAAAAQSSRPASHIDAARQPYKFNIHTYKFHSMGDYVPTIRRLGTTDNYSTATNELSHRSPVSAYGRTNKKDFERQIKRSDEHDDIIGEGTEHHIVAGDEGRPLYLKSFLAERADDPAYKGFAEALQNHLLLRLLRMMGDKEPDITKRYSAEERKQVTLVNGRIFAHAQLRINYTTYDVRRAQDCVNCNSQKCNIMLLSDDDTQSDITPVPFWYARVLGIYHTRVVHPILAPREKLVQFLWVRWFGRDNSPSGWRAGRLDRIGYVPSEDEDAFSFLDPSLVLRACHLIPAFAHGRTPDLLDNSTARDSDEGDWQYYYVNRSAPSFLLCSKQLNYL
ncbi:hypothetical protein EXIGLDRAFT_623736 [Exidia glandulosa HHB12029]|uniref:Uncharacterized protein n=1 Tax=Exidia glandulosa HHB12029 TaxID=1314781 RepID=A0A165DM16_EXIGL|nr:hypothetical protein EXIGLDRAFT_623736 [Exidia glandulosa HHB12029]